MPQNDLFVLMYYTGDGTKKFWSADTYNFLLNKKGAWVEKLSEASFYCKPSNLAGVEERQGRRVLLGDWYTLRQILQLMEEKLLENM